MDAEGGQCLKPPAVGKWREEGLWGIHAAPASADLGFPLPPPPDRERLYCLSFLPVP